MMDSEVTKELHGDVAIKVKQEDKNFTDKKANSPYSEVQLKLSPVDDSGLTESGTVNSGNKLEDAGKLWKKRKLFIPYTMYSLMIQLQVVS